MIRDSDGDVVVASRGKVDHLLDVFQAEVIACIQGVQAAVERGIGNLVMETDAQLMKQAFYSEEFAGAAAGGLMEELKFLAFANFNRF